MKIAVRYHSRSGNTKKVAEAIAVAVGVQALDMSAPLTERVDTLLLGTAMYAAGIDDAVKQFIADNASMIGRIVSFSTTALAPSTLKAVTKEASAHGVTVSPECFNCRGAFAFMHRSHPNAADLDAAKAFARRAAGKLR